MALTDIAIRNLKPKDKPFKKSDGSGLYIQVNPGGSKIWYLKYRIHGFEKRLSMGHYPVVGLAEARKRRADARLLLDVDRDPSTERKREKLISAQSAATTFRLVAHEFVEVKMTGEGRSPATIKKAMWFIELLEPLHDLPISEIDPPVVLEALRRISARGRHETAKKTRALVSRIFRYAVATLRATNDPAAVLRDALQAPKVRHHSALTNPKDVGELLRAIDAYEGHAITRLAMQILPHLMSRPGELRMAVWQEFNLEMAEWRIPKERMKMRKEHKVPLSRQVLAYLKQLYDLTGPDGFVFPAFHTTRRPLSENTMNQVLRRMGYAKEQMTSHGWRTTASTLLNESQKFSEDAIERSLAHSDRNAMRGTYNRANYWEERVKMHQWWSDHLDLLRDGGAAGEIDGAGPETFGQPGSRVISMNDWKANAGAK